MVTTITNNLESTSSARWNEFLFDSNLKSKQVMSSGLGFIVTSGDHHYDGTRHFTSSIPGAQTLRDAPLSGTVPDQMSRGPIQITENGSVALIPLLKAAGLEIPQLSTDPDLRLRTLYATWIAVLGILSKKGRAGLEAKNRSIEVPRIVQMNPETLAKFRALRVEVVGGRAVRVPTGRYTSAASDDHSQGPFDTLDPLRRQMTVRSENESHYAQQGPPSIETPHSQGSPRLGTPSGVGGSQMTVLSANPSVPVFVEQPLDPFRGHSKVDYQELKLDPALSMPNHHSTIDIGSGTPGGSFPKNSGAVREGTTLCGGNIRSADGSLGPLGVDPPISTIHTRGTVIGPPPGFQMIVGRENDSLSSRIEEGHSGPQKDGREARGAGPPYRILQRKKPEDELKISGTGSLISDSAERVSLYQGETDLLLHSDHLRSAKVSERVDAVDPRPMLDTQLEKQILGYIKSQSSGQLEGRAIAAVAKNIYNSYREVAVHKSRDPNLLDRIEKAILELGQSNQIQLGINGKRFPIQIPSNLPHLRHRFSIHDLEQIYREHREGLAQVNSFSAAARILANSSNRWKHMDRGVAEQLAAAAVAQLIENNLFW